MKQSITLSALTAVALWVAITPPLAAQTSPRDDLLRLVPDNMSFCAILQNLRDRSRHERAPMDALAQFPILKSRLQSPEIKKLLEVQQKVLRELDVGPEALRDELFGDAVVFGYRHGPPNKPEGEQALFLVWARDKALAAKLVDRINQMQLKSGELKELRSLKYKDQSYFQRVRPEKSAGGTEFYFSNDHLLVFATDEALLKGVIDRRGLKPADEKPFWSTMLLQLGIEKDLLTFLVNPRAFDADLADQGKSAKGPESAFLKQFQRCWQAIDGIGFFLDVANGLELGAAVKVRTEALPAEARRWFAEFGKPSDLWKVIPDEALLAIAARTDLPALVELISSFGEPDKKKEILGSVEGSVRAFLPEDASIDGLLKGLGPDWGLWVFAPDREDKTWAPQVMFAMKVQNTKEGKVAEATIRKAMEILGAVLSFGAKESKIQTVKQGGLEVRVFNGFGLPGNIRPSFAVKQSYLLFAGSPDTIRRFKAPPAGPDSDEAPILRISAAGWRKYLAEHKAAIADSIAGLALVPATEIASGIDEILPILKTLDRFEIAIGRQKDLATLIVRLKTSTSP